MRIRAAREEAAAVEFKFAEDEVMKKFEEEQKAEAEQKKAKEKQRKEKMQQKRAQQYVNNPGRPGSAKPPIKPGAKLNKVDQRKQEYERQQEEMNRDINRL